MNPSELLKKVLREARNNSKKLLLIFHTPKKN
jgi:hypothetical protein